MRLWVIYERPVDAPGHYVLRRWVAVDGRLYASVEATTHATLEAARAHLPEGLSRIERQPDDDPCIAECWL